MEENMDNKRIEKATDELQKSDIPERIMNYMKFIDEECLRGLEKSFKDLIKNKKIDINSNYLPQIFLFGIVMQGITRLVAEEYVKLNNKHL